MSSLEKYLKKAKILWNPTLSDPYHPCLTSGKHSDIYINCTKILESYNLTTMLLRELDEEYIRITIDKQKIKTLCGLQTGGIGVLYTLPSLYSFLTTLRLVHTEKNQQHRITRWDIDKIPKPIMLVDDVITTGSSIATMMNHYSKSIFADHIICLINRTGLDKIKINNKEFGIISALTITGNKYSIDTCPYCKAGSKAIRPKAAWDNLN